MSDIIPIKTNDDYESAVAELVELLDAAPEVGSAEDVKIRILTSLISDYESAIVPETPPNPVEAIKFRIEQLGLKEKDLVPYLGSRSRVSEVLNGKRDLTVAMIKNLEDGLGIPSSILIGSSVESKNKRWSPKSIKLMALRGYFGKDNSSLEPETIIKRGLLSTLFDLTSSPAMSLKRQTNYRNIESIDQNLMDAWTNKVLVEAQIVCEKDNVKPFEPAALTHESITALFRLSAKPDGVKSIIKELLNYGVIVVIEPHLVGTRLDGATVFTERNPVIGITLRHDRMDNFWFTLAHELAHVLLHKDADIAAFYDQIYDSINSVSKLEDEADLAAGDFLIPRDDWSRSPLRYASTPTLVKRYADKVGVHESVVAGRIRYDSKDWLTHVDMVSSQHVRQYFGDIIWEI